MNTHIGFGFDVSDGSTIVGHCFVWIAGIRSTVQTLDDFPHIWAIWIRHSVLKETFLTYCLVSSRRASIHFCQFWWIVRRRLFRVRILARTCGVIQGLEFLLDFVFPTCIVAAEMRISLKRDIRRDKFGSSGRLFIFDSTSLEKHDQSTPLCRHLPALGTTCF